MYTNFAGAFLSFYQALRLVKLNLSKWDVFSNSTALRYNFRRKCSRNRLKIYFVFTGIIDVIYRSLGPFEVNKAYNTTRFSNFDVKSVLET